MNEARTDEFPLVKGLVMLNHPSFGLMTRAIMRRAEQLRSELESDPFALVDVVSLLPRLTAASDAAAHQLGLATASFALTQNATAGAAATMRSLALPTGAQVVVLATEYTSIVRGWQVRCEEAGASFVLVRVPHPLVSTEQLLEHLEAHVRGDVAIAQLSLVSSSTAITFPVGALAAWFRARGARVLLDAAHGPGHVPLTPESWGVSAMFGTLHKWFPTPRPVGFLWLEEALRDVVRPGEVSLTWDASDLVERFAWPGTFDPTPRLCVEAAIDQWNAWSAGGALEGCVALADYASARLEAAGGTPTCSPSLRPPRLRAVVLGGVSPATVRAALDAASVRAWTGEGPSGETMLRLATHVYNDEADVDRACDAVTGLGER